MQRNDTESIFFSLRLVLCTPFMTTCHYSLLGQAGKTLLVPRSLGCGYQLVGTPGTPTLTLGICWLKLIKLCNLWIYFYCCEIEVREKPWKNTVFLNETYETIRMAFLVMYDFFNDLFKWFFCRNPCNSFVIYRFSLYSLLLALLFQSFLCVLFILFLFHRVSRL